MSGLNCKISKILQVLKLERGGVEKRREALKYTTDNLGKEWAMAVNLNLEGKKQVGRSCSMVLQEQLNSFLFFVWFEISNNNRPPAIEGSKGVSDIGQNGEA